MDGVVYQKDLGPDSINIVKKMERYNTDKSWHRTDHEESSGFTPRMALV
jgi:hypothetical protein